MKKESIIKFIKNIVPVIVLIVAITFLVKWVTNLEVSKGGAYENIRSFYKQEKDSLDVVFVGSSRVYCNINPVVLWEKYGIKSFDFATSGQNISTAPLFIKEIFKYQHPEVVVVEVSQFDDGNPIYGMDMLWATTGLRPSIEKIKYVWERSNKDVRGDFVLSFPAYHHLYTEIDKDDALFFSDVGFPKTGAMGHKGFYPNYAKKPHEEPEELSIDSTEVTDETFAAIDEAKAICDENDCKLLMLYAPSIGKDSFTKLTEYAKNNDIMYLNANECYDKLKFNYDEDFSDELHMTYSGANRFSNFLGEYLSENIFDSTPLKAESDMVRQSYNEYREYISNGEAGYNLVRTGGLGDYFNLFFPNPNYVMIVTLTGDYDKEHYGQETVLKGRCGIDYESYLNGGTWIFKNNSLAYYSAQDEELDFVMEVGGKTISAKGNRNFPSICVDGKDYSVLKNGNRIPNSLQVITFDMLQNEVIDAIAFDADNNYAWNRNPEFMR